MIDDPEIAWLRKQIDAIDHQLLALLSQRLDVVLRVGDKKREKNLPLHDPSRESALLSRLSADAQAPIDGPMVAAVFRAIVSECRRIEGAHMAGESPSSEG